MPKMYFTFFLSLLILPGFGQANATWTGGGDYPPGQSMTTIMRVTGGQKKIHIAINASGSVTGVLDVVFDKAKAVITGEGVGQSCRITGNFDSSKKLLLLILTEMQEPGTEIPKSSFQKPDSVYYSIDLAKKDSTLLMTGIASTTLNRNATVEWIGNSQRGGFGMDIRDNVNMHLLPMRIKLEKTVKKDSVSTVKEQPKVTARKKEIQHTIFLDTSFIKIDMYDNGEIDGDIATLLLDGKIIMSSTLLSTKAASITANLSTEQPEHILELFADNLGAIPPNTALLVLTCGKKRYEINLSSNPVMNGSVKLVFKAGSN